MQCCAQGLMDLFDHAPARVLRVWASDILPRTRAVETVFMVSNKNMLRALLTGVVQCAVRSG
jgi:bisphosphoglycerate-dependent phosphoglycerate mutase